MTIDWWHPDVWASLGLVALVVLVARPTLAATSRRHRGRALATRSLGIAGLLLLIPGPGEPPEPAIGVADATTMQVPADPEATAPEALGVTFGFGSE